MHLRMWTYDLAREQCPSLEVLRLLCEKSVEAGYTHLGLYLEHRFAYPSAPWAHGTGCVTPAMVKQIVHEFPALEIVPFVNLLGHMEGFLYTEKGKKFFEERFKNLQACPLAEGFSDFVMALLDDVLDAFPSQLVHIGGDETALLGHCPKCKAFVEQANESGKDGKAVLYGRHFRQFANHVVAKGRTPAMWGDIFLEHPSALEAIPKETVLFDWQYFGSPMESANKLRKSHKVVLCPTLHTYNSPWLHLTKSADNLASHILAVDEVGAEGVCLTTWEQDLFGNYEALLPVIVGAGRQMNGESITLLEQYREESHALGDWAEVMGIELPKLGGAFAFSQTRSSLKCRLLLQANPFLAWKHHAEEFSGDRGKAVLALLEKAMAMAPDAPTRAVTTFCKSAVEFVRLAEQARQAYAEELPGVAVASLAPCRQIFEALETMAKASNLRVGGSLADIERCRAARAHVEVVIRRIKEFGDGHLGYLPCFESITDHRFIPHDQGCWWRINDWSQD